MAGFTKVGYGQVEPNHLSAQRTAQIYAQLPADSTITVLENGHFVKYDYEHNKVVFDSNDSVAGEYMMVFNEVKLYDEWRESYKDFALKTADSADGKIYPRVIKTNVGDIYTTNCVADRTSSDGDYAVGNKLVPGANGLLAKKASLAGTENMVWNVVAITTMPDGSAALKLQRIK